MGDTVYRVVAIAAGGGVTERVVTSESKAIETCERWGRVPTFTRVGYMPSFEIDWDHGGFTITKKEQQ
ncbi:hypothetical protein PBI_BEAGLE_53 [Arthrobacter phage Beagle]|nr:hypothetical protein PBI_BEAGLE_53 [Arthrobacter phage Beagle]